ncbi:MgtC/SapB family protein [Paenibacillus cremeus]|uniref:MgtC/SapB family protein n=1 Tax=Paenibacillus cremeus TaxID=2163881 RepID=A0A559KCF1_9BACL|nr:MgtC/SapB family protein [Paenibacillus cremeus]
MPIAADIWHITHLELTIRVLLAAGLGGLIGLEREYSNHAAGFRTHILVCIGSAAIMLLSIYGFSEFVIEANVRIDPARLAAQVISGIGFLGAGAILRNGSTVSGLTTAASVWVVAAIGLCVGAGFFYCAFLSTVLVLMSLFVLNKWEKRLMRGRRYHEVVVRIHDRPGVLGKIATLFGQEDIQIVNVKMKMTDQTSDLDGERIKELHFSIKTTHSEKLDIVMENISNTVEVVSLESNAFKLQKTQSIGRTQVL